MRCLSGIACAISKFFSSTLFRNGEGAGGSLLSTALIALAVSHAVARLGRYGEMRAKSERSSASALSLSLIHI